MIPLLLSALLPRLLPLVPLSQIAQTQSPEQSDPLISQGSDMAIYIGLFLLVAAASLAIGAVNRKIEYALLFAFTLAIIMTAVLWNL